MAILSSPATDAISSEAHRQARQAFTRDEEQVSMKKYVLPDWVKPGASFAVDYGEDNPNNHLLHIRGIVDGMAVCRRWSREKQRWRYEVLDAIYFAVTADSIRPRALGLTKAAGTQTGSTHS